MRNQFGWSLPPGVTDHMIDEAAGAFEPEVESPQFYCVAVYLIDRVYGGPEEGGWYYEAGKRIDDVRECAWAQPAIFGSDLEDEASEYCRRVNVILDRGLNAERRSDIGSVLSEGRYVARLCEGYPETHYPAVRPHYE